MCRCIPFSFLTRIECFQFQQVVQVRLASLDEYKDLSAIIADVFAPNMGEAKWWWSRFQAYTGMVMRHRATPPHSPREERKHRL